MRERVRSSGMAVTTLNCRRDFTVPVAVHERSLRRQHRPVSLVCSQVRELDKPVADVRRPGEVRRQIVAGRVPGRVAPAIVDAALRYERSTQRSRSTGSDGPALPQDVGTPDINTGSPI